MKDNSLDFTLIDSNSVIQAKSTIEKQANEVLTSNYLLIKERAAQFYKMWEHDRILKPDLEKVAEQIAIYAVVFALEKKGSGELYAEINKYRTKIKADGYYGHQLLEVAETRVEWLSLSSQELWKIVIQENKLLQICLDFYGKELKR